VLAGAGRPPGVRVILLPRCVRNRSWATPCRAAPCVRWLAGQGERRALDRGHDGGQRRAGLRGLLPFFLLHLGSRGGGSQPVAHRAQSAGLRSRLNDAIRRIEDRHRTDNANNEQVNHEFPSLAEEVFRTSPAYARPLPCPGTTLGAGGGGGLLDVCRAPRRRRRAARAPGRGRSGCRGRTRIISVQQNPAKGKGRPASVRTI
jgi:hypothetical protein